MSCYTDDKYSKPILCGSSSPLNGIIRRKDLTYSFPILGAVSPSRSFCKSKMAAEDMGVLHGEVIITYCTPFLVIEDFYPTFIVFARKSSQAEFEATVWVWVAGGWRCLLCPSWNYS